MFFKKVTAVISMSCLEKVELCLHEIKISGMSVIKGKGYGEYANFFTNDWNVDHAQVSVLVRSEKVKEVVDAIMDAAHCGSTGDGLISVMPVDDLYNIRTKSKVQVDEI